ncbi:MAG: DUF1259 domain-containing protein [Gemmatimonadales bacterium]
MTCIRASGQSPIDTVWKQVGGILETAPTNAGGYERYNFPRSDLHVSAAGVRITPAFALTSWAAFSGAPTTSIAMGDIVVTVAELPKVLKALSEQKIDVTAIHNHLLGEEPRIMYVHFHAAGTAIDIARRLDAVIRQTGAPRPVRAATPAPVTIDTAMVFKALGKSGKASGALAQASFILIPGVVAMNGQTLVPGLAYGTSINVQQVTASRAIATGDLAVTNAQLQPLLTALAANGITATALHNHMIGEQPPVYFVHFWGDAPLPILVRGLRAALDATKQ